MSARADVVQQQQPRRTIASLPACAKEIRVVISSCLRKENCVFMSDTKPESPASPVAVGAAVLGRRGNEALMGAVWGSAEHQTDRASLPRLLRGFSLAAKLFLRAARGAKNHAHASVNQAFVRQHSGTL